MTGTSFLPTMIAVVIVVKINKIIHRFKETGTTLPQTAKTPDELNLKRRHIFNKLLKREVLIENSTNRFYLHVGNLIEYNNKRRMIMFTVILILAIIILTDMLFLYF